MAQKKKTVQGASAKLMKVAARGGLVAYFASDPPPRPLTTECLSPSNTSPIAVAIRKRWPDDPGYQNEVYRRYAEIFDRLPEQDAVKAIDAGYSSPFTAMRAKVIRRRAYRGFKGDR